MNSENPESGVLWMNPLVAVSMGDMMPCIGCTCPFGGVTPSLGGLCGKNCGCWPSTGFCSSTIVLGTSGCGLVDFDPSPLSLEPCSEELLVPSVGGTARVTFFDVRRVGLSVHRRFLPAHRLQGNFLSHFVLVFAQLLHAIGVRPADFGTMPLEGGRGSWLLSLPWTV